jgi:hypothetical protein
VSKVYFVSEAAEVELKKWMSVSPWSQAWAMRSWRRGGHSARWQGLPLVHFSARPEPLFQ